MSSDSLALRHAIHRPTHLRRTAIAFSLYSLAQHPHVQRRLREELLAFGSEPTYADFQAVKLPYLDAVIKEVSVPFAFFDSTH